MKWFLQFLVSSIGQKILMSLSGFVLMFFLVFHLSANMTILHGNGELFNQLAQVLSSVHVLRIMEAFLVLFFALHIVQAFYLGYQEAKARPKGYAMRKQFGTNPTSLIMIYTGSIILLFLVFHIKMFFIDVRMAGNHDMYSAVRDAFKTGWNGWHWLFTVAALAALSAHLIHGVESAFQTLGLRHKKYTPFIRFFAITFAVLIPAAFAVLPVYFHFIQ